MATGKSLSSVLARTSVGTWMAGRAWVTSIWRFMLLRAIAAPGLAARLR